MVPLTTVDDDGGEDDGDKDDPMEVFSSIYCCTVVE